MTLAEVLHARGGAAQDAAAAVGEALALYERKENRISSARARALLAELVAASSR